VAAPAPALVDRLGRPLASPAGGRVGGIVRSGGGHGGTMANWLPRRHNDLSAPRERELIARRAEDLAANDAHAAGLIEGMTTNVVGTGLIPQSQVEAKSLGIEDEEAAAEVRDAIETAFDAWALRADAGNRMNFPQMQSLNIRTMLVQGEYLNLCVNTAADDGTLEPGRAFAMALQSLSPQRLQNPTGQWFAPGVHDGVALGRRGEAIGYWIAQPDPLGNIPLGPAAACRYYPARVAHRPVVLHGFPQTDPEQVRGRSVLAPAMKFFRDLNDCLDYELVGQLVTAAFPVAITSDNSQLFQNIGDMARDLLSLRPEGEQVSEVSPGSILRLYQGEDIKVLDSPRPGSNFEPFVIRILRAASAAAGIPYEVVLKDFSRMNYSNARAALLEAWRVFRRYQLWLEHAFCVPVWRAVVEEGFARDMIRVPKGAPDFYDAMDAYLAVNWIPPRPGHVDPTKETAAEKESYDAGFTTYAEVIAGRGGDWENVMRQRKRELDYMRRLGLPLSPAGQAVAAGPVSRQDKPSEPESRPESPDDEAEQAALPVASPADRPDVHASLARLQAVCHGQTLTHEVRP
jgi:lambda family phage portal protein